MEEDNSLLTGNHIAFGNTPTEGDSLDLGETQMINLVSKVQERFEESKTDRRPHEERMLHAYDNYRGVYGKNVKFRDSEKSRVFVKLTKTKVIAAYGQLLDVILGGHKFPLGIRETPVPEGTEEYEHVSSEARGEAVVEETPGEEEPDLPFDVGYDGDDRVLPPGTTFGRLKGLLGGKKKENNLEPGPTNKQDEPQRATAKEASRQMEKLIHDQLEESNAITELCNAIFEGVLLGTGIIKGPFNYNKTLHKWKRGETGTRNYESVNVRVPRCEFVSVWDSYPDMNATCMEECQYFIQRHRFNKSQLRALSKQPLFISEAVSAALEAGPNYVKESHETLLDRGEEGTAKEYEDRFEVLEYWGSMDAGDLRDVGVELPETVDNLDEIQINAWVCGNELLRVAVNPFKPARIPYQAFSYEKNPYSFFGIGVPENMEDAQQVINAHARMAIDNLAISGNVIFDVDEAALVDGQDFEVHAGKVFRRQTGQPGQAIYPITIPNTTNENLAMVDKFRQFADESTGLPSYSHGATGGQSMTRTASGMSMLLGAASLNIKTVVKSIDKDLLEPLGWAYYHWNMQFYDGDLKENADLEVQALGTSSIMQKEVRSQRLTMLLQTVLHPTLAPYVKLPTLVKELSHSLDLEPEELINNPEEVAIAAAIQGQSNAQTAGTETPGADPQQAAMGGSAGVPQPGGGQGVTGTGDGNIGTGAVSMAGEQEFSAPTGNAATTGRAGVA